MSSASHDFFSASKDGAEAVAITLRSKMVVWWYGSAALQQTAPQSTLQLLFKPQLPPLLSPLPNLFRLIAFLIVAPVVFLCLVDFAGYAIFRTLGFHRRRVRVKRKAPPQVILSPLDNSNKASSTRAPVLTPGAYDADALLRHRERSASAASAEAIQEWTRTGGKFARVSNVRANREAEAAAAQGASRSGSTLAVPDLASPPDSPRNTFGRAGGVGVEGALGYFDTDAEDSGAESGPSSPEIGRRGTRKGLGGGALGFTPVSPEASSTKKSLGLDVPLVPSTYSMDSSDRSPKSNDSVTSSWIRLDESSNEEGSMSDPVAKAAAADLEPVPDLP